MSHALMIARRLRHQAWSAMEGCAKGFGPHTRLYTRLVRWSRLGVFDRIFTASAAEGPKPERIMIDATHLKAHRTAASQLAMGYRANQRRTEFQADTVRDGQGRPIIIVLSEGKMSDHRGAGLVLDDLPPAKNLIADRGYDSTQFREALQEKGIGPVFPQAGAERYLIHTPRACTASATRSKTSSQSSRTDAGLQPDTADARIPSSQQSAPQPPLWSGSDQCVLSHRFQAAPALEIG